MRRKQKAITVLPVQVRLRPLFAPPGERWIKFEAMLVDASKIDRTRLRAAGRKGSDAYRLGLSDATEVHLKVVGEIKL